VGVAHIRSPSAGHSLRFKQTGFMYLLVCSKLNIFTQKNKDMYIEVSTGEVADKISILVIKNEKIADADKLSNVQKNSVH